MPMIVPGVTTSLTGNGRTDEWMNKLMGKKIGDASDTMTFAKKDLPKESRVIEHGGMSTMDHKPERMNVHLNEDGTVGKVTHG